MKNVKWRCLWSFRDDKQVLDWRNSIPKSKYYDNSSKLMDRKMKDETGNVAIEEFVGLKSKMYSFLVHDSKDHKKTKGVNKHLAATITHNDHKDDVLNQKCLRHSMNRIQRKIIE